MASRKVFNGTTWVDLGGGGTPTAPPTTNLALWLRADSLSLSDADPVSSWSDESGNVRHAAQATSANRPIFKTNQINGKPIVRFDGTNDYLTGTAWGFNDEMVIMVMKPTSVATSDGFFCRSTGAGNDWNARNGLAIEAGSSGGALRGTYGLSGGITDAGQAEIARIGGDPFAIYVHTLSGGTQRMTANRSQVVATDTYTAGAAAPTLYAIGARMLSGAPSSNNPAMDLAEIVAYSDYNRTRHDQTLEYLAAKYALTLM